MQDQIADTFNEFVEVTRVGVNFEIENETESYVAVPTEFKLFLGEGEAAEDWDDSVTIPFEDDRVENGQFIVEPGENIALSIENVDHLVTALNDLTSIGVGYQSPYRMADTGHGADIPGAIQEFGLCILEVLATNSFSSCPEPSELLGWHLTLKKFELVIEAEADLEIPEIPECSEFAETVGLDLLEDACPS
ncbi:MAG: hypothetical protein M5R36_03325 [Deltaproteobacteria bacterium]|nr:hypothetical protein [Deltaproteobacteria bacterium]